MLSGVDPLTPTEARVLGALIEKDLTTPEYYPLTLNALTNACNQKSNRDPVMNLDESEVHEAVRTLREKGLGTVQSGSRVEKFGHRIGDRLNLGRRELPLICVLLLRGPQTPGELRGRTDRMHEFADLEELEAVLERLASRESDPLVVKLPRQPGTKEARWAHLLGGPVDLTASEAAHEAAPRTDRIAALEAAIAELREEMRELRSEVDRFRRQFE